MMNPANANEMNNYPPAANGRPLNTVVVSQPTNSNPAGAQATDEIRENWVLSVFGCLCCFIIGVVALIFSFQTRSAKNKGNYVDAEKYSKLAKILGIVALVLGTISAIVFTVVRVE